MTYRTVSGLNGVQDPFDKADCNSVALIAPDLSLSTLKSKFNMINLCHFAIYKCA